MVNEILEAALFAVPHRLRGRWYAPVCRWAMRRWHPELRRS